jgi:antitoxin component YwqK of YwqJK toxin-antitoxin module
MIKKLILVLISFTIYACNNNKHADINDSEKRNESWIYWIDSATDQASWVKVSGNETTVKDGKFTLFYSKGAIYKKGTLKNGKEIDTTFFFNKNEKVVAYSLFKSDTIIPYYVNNGSYILHFQNGKVWEKGIVENHKQGKTWIRYYKSGKIDWTENRKNGKGIVRKYYENGKPKEICNWLNEVQHGLCEFFYENGNKEQVSNWVDGKREGKFETWFENGQKECEYFFKDGKLDGICRYYDENGKLTKEASFKNGQIQ